MRGSHERYIAWAMPLVRELIIPLNAVGMKLDSRRLHAFRREHAERLRSWRARAEAHFKRLGEPLPLGRGGGLSSPQTARILFERLGLPERFHPKTGQLTVAHDALEGLKRLDTTGTVEVLLERQTIRAAETCLKVQPDPDGRVRSRYVLGGDEKSSLNETGRESPGTGRLASREPNLQNVPERYRAMYVASGNWHWVRADLSQIEMRLVAWFSGDRALRKALESDIYLWGVWQLNGLLYQLPGIQSFAELTRQRERPDVDFARWETKRVILAWAYRMGARKLEAIRGVPFQRGRLFLESLNELFPGVVRWWDELVSEAFKNSEGSGFGWLQNPAGRRRYFPMEDVPALCNFLPQSTAADILYDIGRRLQKRLPKVRGRLIGTLHDEYSAEGPRPSELAELMREEFERPIPWLGNQSFPAAVLSGRNWAKRSEENPEGVH
jgi:DNA polymerase I-like protein with 3'-5' exonuclease and polymerase domains